MNLLAKRDPFTSIFDNLINDFFHSWPSETKPPLSLLENLDTNDGIDIQLALAGFTEEDIKVWNEGRVLHIEGDNTHRENISNKFRHSFHRCFSLKSELDLEKAEASLKNGILTVKVPSNSSEVEKRYLIGKPPKAAKTDP